MGDIERPGGVAGYLIYEMCVFGKVLTKCHFVERMER
jgi:hypothetical protein